MSVAQVEEHIREKYDGQDLLDALPPHDTLDWIPFSIHPQAHVPFGLVLGNTGGRNVVAFCTQQGDKAPEIRYCSTPIEHFSSTYPIKPLPQDSVLDLDLKIPFKYITGTAKSKRKLSNVIKWYFMNKALLGVAISGSIDDWCKIFCKALEDIQSRIADEPGRSTRSDARGRNDAVQGNAKVPGRRVTNGLAWGRQNVQDANMSALATASHKNHLYREGGTMTDCDAVCDYLEEKSCSHLLKNINNWKELEWYDGGSVPNSLPYKFVVGKTAQDKANIYAHLRVVNNAYVVQFWSKPRSDKANGFMPTKSIAAQDVRDPFDKIFGKNCRSLSKSEEERLEILVKWYFIAGGKVHDLLERERNYPARFIETLKSIGKQINYDARNLEMSQAGPTSHHPPTSSPIDEDSVQVGNLRPPIISPGFSSPLTSPNFPTLAFQNGQITPSRSAESRMGHNIGTATPESSRQVAPRSAQGAFRTPQRAQPSPAKKVTKRTADDASLDDIIAEVNQLDEDIEFHDFKKDAHDERKKIDSQDFKAKQIEDEKIFEEKIQEQRKKFKEDQTAKEIEWEGEQNQESQAWMEKWQRDRDQLAEVREELRQRRRQKRIKGWRESGIQIEGVNGVHGD